MTSRSEQDAPVLVLFRNDLRIADNRALAAAAATGRPVLAAFVFDEESPGIRPLGGARRWWLHHSLARLTHSLAELGVPLLLRRGRMGEVVEQLLCDSGAGSVFWNRRYAPPEIAADTAMKTALRAAGIQAESFEGHLLHEPSRLTTKAGGGFRVYTPFWNALASSPEPRDPLPPPERLHAWAGAATTLFLDDLALLPTRPDWSGGLQAAWAPGEHGAQQCLDDFLDDAIRGYADRRDLPGCEGTSRLSPHLAFGEITPYQIIAGLRQRGRGETGPSALGGDIAKFHKELGWREFCYHLLFHNPDLRRVNYLRSFDGFPWREDADALRAWQRGQTGYPMVDAGMRQLWQTGWMHNRVRMVVASFLVKHLLIDWRLGEEWFWDTLVDADAASNPASWQWVAGSGADAAPYFRVFNPVLQGEKFDSPGAYVRAFVPELAELPDKYLHKPWEAPAQVLSRAGVVLGRDYPTPIVPHSQARARALDAYSVMRGAEPDVLP